VSGDAAGKVRIWDIASTVLAHGNEDDGSFDFSRSRVNSFASDAGDKGSFNKGSFNKGGQQRGDHLMQAKDKLKGSKAGGGCCVIA
jgi:hypothetical protein